MVARILALRALAPPARLAKSHGFLLPRCGGRHALYQTLLWALAEAAKPAGCSGHVTPHRLRHSWAAEMLRLGVSLPALMQLLGHKDIRLALRYVQVTQQDLQRIQQALAATRHLLEMYRRQLSDEKTRLTLQRLDHRLLAVASQLDRITTAEK